MTGIRWGFTFLMGVESGWRLQRSTVRCNPRQRYRRRKTSPALSRKRTNTAPGNGLFRQLAAAEKPIRNDECAVGAVCDRPQCRNEDIAGAHRAPLQFAYIFVPEFRMGLDEIRHHLNAGRIFKYDDGDSVRPE